MRLRSCEVAGREVAALGLAGPWIFFPRSREIHLLPSDRCPQKCNTGNPEGASFCPLRAAVNSNEGLGSIGETRRDHLTTAPITTAPRLRSSESPRRTQALQRRPCMGGNSSRNPHLSDES